MLGSTTPSSDTFVRSGLDSCWFFQVFCIYQCPWKNKILNSHSWPSTRRGWRRLRKISMYINTYWAGNKDDWDSLLSGIQRKEKRQWARKKPFRDVTVVLPYEWPNIGKGFPQMLLSLWKYSKFSWTRSWTTCSRRPCSEQDSWTKWCPEVRSKHSCSTTLMCS